MLAPLDFRQLVHKQDGHIRQSAMGNGQFKSVRMKLIGANPTAQVQGAEKLSGVTN
jgi:hypothetical protein